jgi:hypothetical protein
VEVYGQVGSKAARGSLEAAIQVGCKCDVRQSYGVGKLWLTVPGTGEIWGLNVGAAIKWKRLTLKAACQHVFCSGLVVFSVDATAYDALKLAALERKEQEFQTKELVSQRR